MLPYFTMLIIAIIGAVVNGLAGFFIWGIAGIIGVIAFGYLLNWFSGGALPRKVRDETATDFIACNPELIKSAFPSNTPYEAKKHIETLLNSMMERAAINNPSVNLEVAANPQIFLPSALEIAEEQPSDIEKQLAIELVAFIRQHNLWYGDL